MGTFPKHYETKAMQKVGRAGTQALDLNNIISKIRQFSVSSAQIFPVGLDDFGWEDDISIAVLAMPTSIFRRIFGDKNNRWNNDNSGLSPDELATFIQYGHHYQDARHQQLTFEGLLIDPACREIVVNGASVSLPPIEFELLWFLARHPRQAFTRAQLLDCVWGYDYVGGESTVTVHVRRLREKIEGDPTNPTYIHTIWGIGYKFDVL